MGIVHGSAIVDDSVKLGRRRYYWPVLLRDRQRDFGGRRVCSKVMLSSPAIRRLVKPSTMCLFASIGHIPQVLKFGNEDVSSPEIGTRRNRIREHVTMNPGTKGGGGW